MKYLGLILVLALVTSQVLTSTGGQESKHQHVRKSIDEKFRDFLENLKLTLREGNDTLGIPRLDPFDSKDLNVTLNEKKATGTARLQNLHVTGLSDYTVNETKLALLFREMTIGMTWPKIDLESLYTLDITALEEFKISGDGNFTTTLTNFYFRTVAKFSIFGGVQVTNMNTIISLGGLKFAATGLFHDSETSEMLSEVITDVTPQLIETYQVELTTIVNKKLMEMINEQLKGKSLSDILQLLG